MTEDTDIAHHLLAAYPDLLTTPGVLVERADGLRARVVADADGAIWRLSDGWYTTAAVAGPFGDAEPVGLVLEDEGTGGALLARVRRELGPVGPGLGLEWLPTGHARIDWYDGDHQRTADGAGLGEAAAVALLALTEGA